MAHQHNYKQVEDMEVCTCGAYRTVFEAEIEENEEFNAIWEKLTPEIKEEGCWCAICFGYGDELDPGEPKPEPTCYECLIKKNKKCEHIKKHD